MLLVRTLVCLPICLLLAPSYPAVSVVQPSRRLPTSGAVEQVLVEARHDGLPNPENAPLGFLEACLKEYDKKKIKGYTLSFWKRESIDGKEQPVELIDVYGRDQPHSVYFVWQQGARLAQRALYVEGENKNAQGRSEILVLPAPPLHFAGVQRRDPESADAKKSGRYPINTFGIKQGMERIVNGMRAAQAANELHVEYLGRYKIMDASGRTCHVIRRHSFVRPEGPDGVSEIFIFVDCETLFQIGSVSFAEDGHLLGEYYFRDIILNPEFAEGHFSPAVLKKK